jgi:putative glutamine amidotransferase
MPTIGITQHAPHAPDREELDLLCTQIADAVTRAGGTPVPIAPQQDEAALRAHFAQLDGLILSGGGDVDPAAYGATPIPAVGGVDGTRDWTEMTLARWALEERKPLFGICRGLQLLNVALGGTLYQDMSEYDEALPHRLYPDLPFDLLAHPVAVTPGSLLAQVLGTDTVEVNSLHHQACATLAPAVIVTARAPDGMVEALEVPGHPFALAVQWHPEALPESRETAQLFRALVVASATADGQTRKDPTPC